ELVLTADMLVEGVHVPRHVAPADFAYKALAVNVSDLVAKGADPTLYLLTLCLPKHPEPGWLEAFTSGLSNAQADFGCSLAGGDTVSAEGPVCLSITAAGTLPAGKMIHRFSANPDDKVFVTGTIGDAAAGLALIRKEVSAHPLSGEGAMREFLLSRYFRPHPPVAAIELLRQYASAAMDISDGLVLDFTRLCAASGCGGIIEADRVPLSPAVSALLEGDAFSLEAALTGGDDYEVLFTAAPGVADAIRSAAESRGLSLHCIGSIVREPGITVVGRDGAPMQISRPGYDHF
ncbi:MAG: thiamine-phosphate kinase, partial [Alphaproteobacteria bacterium]